MALRMPIATLSRMARLQAGPLSFSAVVNPTTRTALLATYSTPSRSICSSPLRRQDESNKGSSSSQSSLTPPHVDAVAAADPAVTSDTQGLPILPRPLGQRTPPSTTAKTWKQKTEAMMDQENRKKKRDLLVKQATQGYFHDYNQIKRKGSHGGKTWIAPPVLIREDRALYFPDVTGTILSGGKAHSTDMFKGKVSVVAILNARISAEHVESFVADVLQDWEGDSLFQYVQLNHQPNFLKNLLLQMVISNIKRTMKSERWSTYMIAGGDWDEVKESLSITNKHVGYVYVVDPAGKVRWAGCGYATAEEQESLRKSVAVLMGRVKESFAAAEGQAVQSDTSVE